MSRVDTRAAARMLFLLNPRSAYHRAEIRNVERLPESSAAVIVSNHGRLDFDTFILIRLVLRSRGRLMRLMADHMWFRLPVFGRLFQSAGAVDGTRPNAMHLLSRDEMVLTYPGGVREIMGSRFGHEHIDWDGRRGFAHVAVQANAPVIPVVGVGVNNGHIFLTSGRFLGRLLFQYVLRLGPAYAEYRDPLTIGVLPLPLPFGIAVNLPFPCKVTYFVGQPVYPSAGRPGEATPNVVEDLARRVIDQMNALIAEHGTPT